MPGRGIQAIPVRLPFSEDGRHALLHTMTGKTLELTAVEAAWNAMKG